MIFILIIMQRSFRNILKIILVEIFDSKNRKIIPPKFIPAYL